VSDALPSAGLAALLPPHLLLDATLLAAAALKLTDPTGTALAAATFGLGGTAARHAWLARAVLEAGLAVGLLAGASWVVLSGANVDAPRFAQLVS